MTERSFQPTEEMLHAFVDGCLPEPQREAVETWLRENPGEALRFEAYRQQNEALRTLGVMVDARPPLTLPEPPARGRWLLPALGAAAAVALLVLAAAGGWWLHGHVELPPGPADHLVRQAVNAHLTYAPEVLHPVEVGRDQEEHLESWLSRRLGAQVRAPELEAMGYELMGGRLVPAERGPAALLMYQDERGRRLSLYLLSSPTRRGDTSFRYVKTGPAWVCYWLTETMDFALIGEVERKRLVDIAKNAYMQLTDVAPPDVDAAW